MINFWYFLYNFIALPLLRLFFFVAKFFNSKIKTGIEDRKKLFENLIIDLTGLDRRKKMVWFHSASMGEFEQAKPIIQALKAKKNCNVIITFFSPSGYRNSLKYPYADVISYIPLDTPELTNRFINLVKPNIAIFMRYDIWPNVIWQLKTKNIPCFIVDATMRGDSKRKLPVARGFHKSLYSGVTRILAVSEDDVRNFEDYSISKEKLKAVGDTRFDRVYQKSIEAKDKKLFKSDFFEGKKVFVFGSSWESDEEVMIPAILKLMEYDKDVVLIIAPHEPTEQHLEKLESDFTGREAFIRFSYLNNYKNERIIIIDSIGILLTLYYYAHAAYVGGSFKQGIHNVLEPAVYGIPVLFGPKIENSQEAKTLVQRGGAVVIKDKKEAFRILRSIFGDKELKSKMGKISFDYVNENIGATNRILEEIINYIG